MAEKRYLDSDGLRQLVDYINRLHISQKNAIDRLYGSNETPGSISKMIADAIAQLDITDFLQGDTVRFYGGSATEVMNSADYRFYGGSAFDVMEAIE